MVELDTKPTHEMVNRLSWIILIGKQTLSIQHRGVGRYFSPLMFRKPLRQNCLAAVELICILEMQAVVEIIIIATRYQLR